MIKKAAVVKYFSMADIYIVILKCHATKIVLYFLYWLLFPLISVVVQARRQIEQIKVEDEEEEIRQFGQAKKVNLCDYWILCWVHKSHVQTWESP